MEPRALRTLAVIVVMLLLALAAFALLLRRYQSELAEHVVRPAGAPALPAPVKGGEAPPDMVVTAAESAVTSAVVEGVRQVDTGGPGAK